jgi:hypothetical protein
MRSNAYRIQHGFADRFSKSVCWASPGFPVYLIGVGKLHAAFFNESRTRGRWWRPVAGNPSRPSFSAHVRPTASRGRFGEHGAPVRFPLDIVMTQALQRSSHHTIKAS